MKTQDLEDMLQFIAACGYCGMFFWCGKMRIIKALSFYLKFMFFCQKRLLLLIMYNSNFTNTLIIHPCPCQSPVDRPREKQLLKKPHTFKLDKLKALYYVSNLD